MKLPKFTEPVATGLLAVAMLVSTIGMFILGLRVDSLQKKISKGYPITLNQTKLEVYSCTPWEFTPKKKDKK